MTAVEPNIAERVIALIDEHLPEAELTDWQRHVIRREFPPRGRAERLRFSVDPSGDTQGIVRGIGSPL